jgi:CHAD domain-containing protein
MKRSSPSTSIYKRHSRLETKRLLSYYDERSQAISAVLNSVRARITIEGVHKLRVEIKQLRAFYQLIGYVIPSFAPKPDSAFLNGLFEAAGDLRNLDICRMTALRHKFSYDLHEYSGWLDKMISQSRSFFIESIAQFDTTIFAENRIPIFSALSIVQGEQLKKRTEKKVAKLTERLCGFLMQKNPDINDLHKTRKLAKTLRSLLYVQKQCLGENKAIAEIIIQLEKIGDCLGKWRDVFIARESVVSFLETDAQISLADPPSYGMYMDDLRLREERLLNAFNRIKKSLQKSLEAFTTEPQII